MPSKDPKPSALVADEEMVVISSFRVPASTLDKFDAWVAEQNGRRRGPKLSRADVIRGLMDWAADEKPKWEEM